MEQKTSINAQDGEQMAGNAAFESASRLIDARIKSLPDWRGEMLSRIRRLIKQADPEVVEEVKWRKPSAPMGVPVWSHDGIICTGETYQNHVKLTFARGARLKDPAGLFNASLEGNARRAIDLHEGDEINERAFKSLVQAAAALNEPSTRTKPNGKAGRGERTTATQGRGPSDAEPPKVLSGGNPQITKADGNAPVQAYIAAMPGWKSGVGHRLDELIVRTVPNVRKAVRWNSPFYGVEGQGWFLSYHCFTRYVKVVFLRGGSLRPLPPVESKDPNTRYFHIHEDDQLDEELMASWIRQASDLPGDPLF
jgi:hypothetical protein